jgi:hypothetical protein
MSVPLLSRCTSVPVELIEVDACRQRRHKNILNGGTGKKPADREVWPKNTGIDRISIRQSAAASAEGRCLVEWPGFTGKNSRCCER